MLRPAFSKPTHNLPFSSSVIVNTELPGRLLLLCRFCEKLRKRPVLVFSRQRPPPSVPIHRRRLLSPKTTCTLLSAIDVGSFGLCSYLVNELLFRLNKFRPSPTVPIQILCA